MSHGRRYARWGNSLHMVRPVIHVDNIGLRVLRDGTLAFAADVSGSVPKYQGECLQRRPRRGPLSVK